MAALFRTNRTQTSGESVALSRRALTLALAFLLLIVARVVLAQEQVPGLSPTPPRAETIPATQVLWRVESLSLVLQDISKRLSSGLDLDAIEANLETREEEIKTQSAATLSTLGGTPTLTELQDSGQYWRALLEMNLPQHSELARRGAAVNADIATLDREQKQLQATFDQNQDPNSLETVYDRLRDALLQIQTLLAKATDQQRRIIALQFRLAAEDALASDLLERLHRERQQFARRLFERDSLPLWKFEARRTSWESVDSTTRGQIRPSSSIDFQFMRAQSRPLTVIVLVFLLNLVISLRLRKKWVERAAESRTHAQVAEIFGRPVALSLVAAFIVMMVLDLNVPLALLSLLGLVMVVPVLRLLPPLIGVHWRPILYLLSVSFMQTVIRHSLVPPSPLVRELDLLFTLGVIICFFYFTLKPDFREATAKDLWSRVTIRAAWIAVFLLSVSLAAGVLGYVRLSQIMNRATIYSSFIALLFFTGFRLTMITLNAILKTDRVSGLATVRLRKKLILQWTERVLAALAVFSWLTTTSELLMVGDPVRSALLGLLTWRLTLGTLNFSLGDILTVVIVLFVGFGFSTAVRFVVREEVLSRVHLSRGLPELITTLLYYGLIIIVVVMAFGAAGVEFSRLTLITGALGVGIGFGLQNIVNNFVSGLILQFERPIHVGDVLEVGGFSGEVTRIGVRSSTIQTAQGAEVIVPNADLVAGRVINWTLSSERRRVDIPVVVAHGTEPKRVIDLLTRVALENQNTMRDPAPVVLFQSFNENGLSFELRFWAPDRTSYLQLKSDVTLSVIEALTAERIEIPATQRDLYLKTIEEAVKAKFGGVLVIGDADPPPTTDGTAKK